MKLNPEIESVFNKIDFINCYQELSKGHMHELNEMMENYDNQEVLSLFNSLDVKAKHMKKENFFKIVDKVGDVKFQFNISLKYGACEMIWAMWIEGTIQRLGPWAKLVRMIDIEHPSIKPPSFTTYDELKEILVSSLELFDSFKKEVLETLDKSE